MRRPTGKRRTHHRTSGRRRHTSRRRRVSGFKTSLITDALVVGAGGVLAREGANIILKAAPTMSLTTIAIGQIVAGIVLPQFLKNRYADDLSKGIAAIGVTQLAVSMHIISGAKRYLISGTPFLAPVNGGTDKLLPVNGAPAADIPASQNRYVKNFASVV